jgi:hypothetical protein
VPIVAGPAPVHTHSALNEFRATHTQSFENQPLKTKQEFSTLRGFALFSAVSVASCGGSSKTAPEPQSPQDLPVYGNSAAQLFDDRIEARAVGLADVGSDPRLDPVLRQRTQNAEVVGRTRVSTINVDSVGGKSVYRLRFKLLDPPVVARGLTSDQLEIAVGDDSPAFGIVKGLDTKLIEYSFIGFFRRFAGSYEPQVRFHLSADDPQVMAAVRDASALRELATP